MSHPKLVEVLAKAFLELVGDNLDKSHRFAQLGMVLLLLPLAYIYLFSSTYEPFHRGFFCDDQSLK